MTTTTHTRNLTTSLAVATGLFLAATTFLPTTSSIARSSSPAARDTSELSWSLAGKDAESTFIDERRSGEGVGDRYVSAATLRSRGEVVGRLQGECLVLDRTYEGHLCQLVLVLEGGQLTATGGGVRHRVGTVRPSGDVFSVTGGTGEYAGAGGELRASDDGRTLTASLVLPAP